MAPQKKPYHKTPGPEDQRPVPRRPSLVQRISGLLTSGPRRRPAETQRSMTALRPDSRLSTRAIRQASGGEYVDEDSLIQTPTLPERPCPYDPNIYQSFPSIEPSRCWSCGLPFPWTRGKEPPLTPCSACRSRSQFSHIVMNSRSSGSRRETPILGTVDVSVSEVIIDLPVGPDYNVPQALLEGRPRPPRRSRPLALESLSRDLESLSIKRFSSSNGRPPARRGSHLESEGDSAFDKLKDYPYVHKHEVASHLAALRAGTPSPIRDHQVEAERRTRDEPNIAGMMDWSNTVYYPRGRSPVPARVRSPEEPRPTSRNTRRELPNSSSPSARNTRQRPHGVRNTGVPPRPVLSRNARLRTVVVSDSIAVRDDQAGSVEAELQGSRVYTLRSRNGVRHTPSPLRHEITGSSSSDDSSFSTGTMPPTPDEIDGTRFELRGGSGSPRLRGGGGREERVATILSTKRYTLTKCHSACESRDRSKENGFADALLARRVMFQQVARAKNGTGRVPHPRHIQSDSREKLIGSNSRNCLLNTARSGRPPNPGGTLHQPSSAHKQKIPHLRGGGGSDWAERVRVPTHLWFLAGGRGSPISVASWNRQKPKNRLGGLCGMAIYGHKAGTPYKTKEGGRGDAKDGRPVLSRTKASLSPPSPSSSASSSSSSSSSSDGEERSRAAPTAPRDSHLPLEANPSDADQPIANAILNPPLSPTQEAAPATSPDDTRGTPEPDTPRDSPSSTNTAPVASSSAVKEGSVYSAAGSSDTTSGDVSDPSAPKNSPSVDDFTPTVDATKDADQPNDINTTNGTPEDNLSGDDATPETNSTPEPSPARGDTPVETANDSSSTADPNIPENIPSTPEAASATNGPASSPTVDTNAILNDGQEPIPSPDSTPPADSTSTMNEAAGTSPPDNAEKNANAPTTTSTSSTANNQSNSDAPLAPTTTSPHKTPPEHAADSVNTASNDAQNPNASYDSPLSANTDSFTNGTAVDSTCPPANTTKDTTPPLANDASAYDRRGRARRPRRCSRKQPTTGDSAHDKIMSEANGLGDAK